jgi:hypothetical protein
MLLAATTGMTVSKHFCNGFLISSSIYAKADSCCNKDCCSDNQEFIQLNEVYQVSESSAVPIINELGIMFTRPEQFDFRLRDQYLHIFKPENKPPPERIQTRLSLRQTYLL